MSRTCWMVLLTAFSSASFLSAQSLPSETTIGPPPRSAEFDWLYAKSISPEARQKLLPLYQQEHDLLQELNRLKWPLAQETAAGLFSGGAGTVRAVNSPAGVTAVEESAARAGQYGAEYRGANAALTAQKPSKLETLPGVARVREIILEVAKIDEQIAATRRQYSIETMGPAAPQGSKQLSPEEVKKLLALAAQQAAKPVGSAPWTGNGTMGVAPVANEGLGSGADFDPSKLTPEGQQARLQNEQIVADETLNASVQNSSNDSSLRVEAITDPILPTKIGILNPPAPTEIGLQNPLSSSPQISLPPTPTMPSVQQPGNATSEPTVGGIRLGGQQQYTEKKGLEAEFEKARGKAK